MKPIHFITPSSREFQDLRALLMQEWKLCRNSVVSLAMVWFIGLWGLVIFDHPGWLLAIGVIYVMKISGVQGGRDVIDGTEEFSFTLPPGRGPLFLARIIPGFVFLTINGVMGWLAIEYNLPQRFWSLLFSSGLTHPFPEVNQLNWYTLSLLAPCAAHGITFTAAALARSRQGVNAAAWVGLSGTGAVVLGLWRIDRPLSIGSQGSLSIMALPAVLAVVLVVGYYTYHRKDPSVAIGPAAGIRSWVLWIIAAIGLMIVATLIFLFGYWIRVRTDQSGVNLRPQSQSLVMENLGQSQRTDLALFHKAL